MDGIDIGGFGEIRRINLLQLSSPEPEMKKGADPTPPVGRVCSEDENELKDFASKLYKLENRGNQVRAMTVAWASFVLLGAFRNYLTIRDFWFSTAVLLQNQIKWFNKKYVLDHWRTEESDSRNMQRLRVLCCCSLLLMLRLMSIPLLRFSTVDASLDDLFCCYSNSISAAVTNAVDGRLLHMYNSFSFVVKYGHLDHSVLVCMSHEH